MPAEDTTEAMPIRLLVVAHVRLYREGLVAVLSGRPGFQVVGATHDYTTTLAQVSAREPTVILIDMTMPEAANIIGAVHRDAATIKLVAFGINEQEPQIVKCIESGAAGYVTCDASIADLLAVITGVARDELLCSPRVVATLGRRLSERAVTTPSSIEASRLTTREWQVLRLIREGLSNKEIAQRLTIAEATVKHHVHNLLDKLDVKTRTQAVTRVTDMTGPHAGVQFAIPPSR